METPLSQYSINSDEPHFHLGASSSTYGYRSQYFQEFGVQGSGNAAIGPIIGDTEFVGAVGLAPKGSTGFFDVPEGVVGVRSKNSNVSFLFGRHKTTWSELDQDWNQGIWQPRNRWDYLNPIPVGLIGGFFKIETPLVTTELFASPIFLPETGAPSTLENGTFVSNSPWFRPPSPFMSFNQQLVPIKYAMEPFSAGDLISKFGASARMRVGHRDSGPYLQLAGGYKPMNQLMIGYDGLLNLSSQEANIRLKPTVGYQRLVGVDGGILNWNGISQKFSILSETALMPPVSDNFTYQQAANAMSYSTTTQWTWNERDRSVVSLGYLRRIGGNSGDLGSLASAPGQSIFEDRYTFSSAAKLGVATGFGFMNWSKLFVQSDLAYDFLNQMEVFKLKFTFQAREDLAFLLGTDLLGSQLPSDVYSQNWIRSFSYNDRVYGGMTYVF